MSQEPLEKLQETFRSLLDEALIVAIANDHDLNQPSEFKAAQEILESLAQNVACEEATGFNPSGLSTFAEEPQGAAPNDATSIRDEALSRWASQSRDTDVSSKEDTSTTTESAYSMPLLTSFNDDSEEDKVTQLLNIFGELKEYAVKYALKKVDWDFQAALDELLNVHYLRSTGQQPKGIDGFFQPDDDQPAGSKKKNKKNKNKRKGRQSPSTGETAFRGGASSPDHLKEMKRQDEIAYVADRFNLPFGEVSEIYYRKRCSDAAAAVEILDQHLLLGIKAQDVDGVKRAKELANKYPNVPEKYMPTVVQFTESFPEWSEDICVLLSKHFAKNPWTEKLELDYPLTPLPREEIEGLDTSSGGRGLKAGGKLVMPQISRQTLNTNPNAYAEAFERASQGHQAKRDAIASAAMHNRRGGSNGLNRQAAGYYAGLAREHGRYAHQATSTAADLLVDQNSTVSSIDLHGVYVQDGVRIARQKVQAWWSGLGEFKTQKARQQSFTVITGLGRHSAGGVSQLRQAVAAALLQDGWKMQVETGRFIITGRR